MKIATNYTVFIDEGGDPGVKDGIRYYDKTHEWFTLGALVVRTQKEPEVVQWVQEIRDRFSLHQGHSLHYHKLSLAKRLPICQMLSGKHVRAFCLASHKSNVREHHNKILGQMSANEYYNWCCRLLLERIIEWAETRCQIDRLPTLPLQIVFSRKGDQNYPKMFNYFDLLSSQARAGAFKKKPKRWNPDLMDRRYWTVELDKERAGLQLADIVASAFLQATNTKSPNFNVEPAKALSKILARDVHGKQANAGLTVWPLPSQAQFPSDAKSIYQHIGYKF